MVEEVKGLLQLALTHAIVHLEQPRQELRVLNFAILVGVQTFHYFL